MICQIYHEEANMINSNWIDPCHHIKQDAIKLKKKDMRHEQDITDMVFIRPDTILSKNGKIIYIHICSYILIYQN